MQDIRKRSDKNGIRLLVTGSTAVNIDISDRLNDAIPEFAILIVGFAFVLLTVVFRSLLVPLAAVVGFLLTMTATLGLSVFVLQDGHFTGLLSIPEKGRFSPSCLFWRSVFFSGWRWIIKYSLSAE